MDLYYLALPCIGLFFSCYLGANDESVVTTSYFSYNFRLLKIEMVGLCVDVFRIREGYAQTPFRAIYIRLPVEHRSARGRARSSGNSRKPVTFLMKKPSDVGPELAVRAQYASGCF